RKGNPPAGSSLPWPRLALALRSLRNFLAPRGTGGAKKKGRVRNPALAANPCFPVIWPFVALWRSFLSKWTGPGLNRRPKDFQSFALPTELPVQIRRGREFHRAPFHVAFTLVRY